MENWMKRMIVLLEPLLTKVEDVTVCESELPFTWYGNNDGTFVYMPDADCDGLPDYDEDIET
jgi:hypothetical protein